MPFTKERKQSVEDTIKLCLRNKFKSYSPKNNFMPFHVRLLGKDRMALFAFIHSLNTTFGSSIFEPVAIEIAKTKFKECTTQYSPGLQITTGTQKTIQKILNELSISKTHPNKVKELLEIRKSSHSGKLESLKTIKADIFLKDKTGKIFLFDLKTTKPNKANFKDFKRTLLEWAGLEFYKNDKVDIETIIALPYNPYHPKPYQNWTSAGMMDVNKELMVGKEFWDFLGGKGTYEELLKCFENVGIELRPEIDKYFSKFI